jgi:hypothetical protein
MRPPECPSVRIVEDYVAGFCPFTADGFKSSLRWPARYAFVVIGCKIERGRQNIRGLSSVIMRLVEGGALDLDEAISTYDPCYAQWCAELKTAVCRRHGTTTHSSSSCTVKLGRLRIQFDIVVY